MQLNAVRYRISEIARAVGCHPNSVRRYEAWGFIAEVPRNSRNGYRQYGREHLEQMRLAWLALKYPYPGGKQVVIELVRQAAAGKLGDALESAYRYLSQIRAEIAQAAAAVEFVRRWQQGVRLEPLKKPLNTAQAARQLGLSPDTLRNWERNHLLRVPRNPRNNYRLYGAAEIGRLRVIRMLREAGYSMMAILRMMLQLDEDQTTDVGRALDTPREDEELLSIADQWLTTLRGVEERAQRVITQIEEMIAME